MTAAEFERNRPDLPDGGRWTELVAGELKVYDPPSVAHGNVVLHLSKAVARVLRPGGAVGAVFDQGVQTRRNPDTVRFPVMALVRGLDHFAALDGLIVPGVPALVLEVADTPARRRETADRVAEYHRLGVPTVWLADPAATALHVLIKNAEPKTLAATDVLTEPDLLPGLELPVESLFAEPAWWRGGRR